MRFLILSFLVLFNLSTYVVHDSVKATFNIIEKGHVLMLEIDFDTDSFKKTNNLESQTISKAVFLEYLNATTNWEIDGATILPIVLSIKPYGHHHTKVVCFLSKAPMQSIKSIKIKNAFLIDVHNHINVIKIDVNKEFKDFKMDKNRQELEVAF
ncbi:DUF6702 family protein [Algibacter sp. R77976]|uniref:DUF6702 family protein n=1 Tax=Algibacter sp. R77976 TaxID=3093873 RepID=UPI0037C97790